MTRKKNQLTVTVTREEDDAWIDGSDLLFVRPERSDRGWSGYKLCYRNGRKLFGAFKKYESKRFVLTAKEVKG